jgi:uncharacterized protein (TIGR02001 family)
VTVPAKGPVSRARGSRTSSLVLGAAAFLFFCPAPARAQVGATLSAFNDLRFRGYSLSEGQPVAILDLAYDDASGVYVDAAATGVVQQGGDPAPLGVQLTGGYAKSLRSGTTIDLGVTQSTYSHYSPGEGRKSYTELYAGIARGALSSRIFLSPHYSQQGLWTAYGELNAGVTPARRWSLEGHVGVLVPLRTPTGDKEHYHSALDWRVGIARELGRLSLHLSWNEGAHGRNFYGDRAHSRGGVVVGASLAL